MKKILSCVAGLSLYLLDRLVAVIAGPWGEMPEQYDAEPPSPISRCDTCGASHAYDLGPYGYRCRRCCERLLVKQGGRS